MTTCLHCEAETSVEHYDRIVHNKTLLHGPWAGWRMAGRYFVSPDGERITPERMRGLLVRLELETRRNEARSRNQVSRTQPVKVVIVDLVDYRHRGIAAA